MVNQKKLLLKGYNENILFFQKLIRDSIPNTPEYTDDKSLKEYISFVNIIKKETTKIKDEYDITHFYENVIKQFGFENSIGQFTPDYPYSYFITEKLIQVSSIKDIEYLNDLMIKSQFLVENIDKKILRNFSFFVYDQDYTTWTLNNNGADIIYAYKNTGEIIEIETTDEFPQDKWKDNTVFIVHNSDNKLVGINYSKGDYPMMKKDILKEYSDEIMPKKIDNNSKIRIKEPYLKNIVRNGVDYRNSLDITTDEFEKVFDFYGVEFGNYETQTERQKNLNYIYDSFMDLSHVLDLSLDAVTLNNTLSLALGSRGTGRIYAHYEPSRQVINLTKLNGSGRLAHEWGHALDCYLAKKFNTNCTYFSESSHPLAKQIMNTCMYKLDEIQNYKINQYKSTQEFYDAIKNVKYFIWKQFNHGAFMKNYDDYIKADMIINDFVTDYQQYIIIDEFNEKLNDYNKLKNYDVEKINNLYYDIYGKQLNREIIDKLNEKMVHIANLKQKCEKDDFNFDIVYKHHYHTDLYKNLRSIDVLENGKETYNHSTRREMFAIAFASYIDYKLKNKKIRNDFLTGHSKSLVLDQKINGVEYNIKGYPNDNELLNISKEFDNLFEKLKELNILSKINQNNISYSLNDLQNKEKKQSEISILNNKNSDLSTVLNSTGEVLRGEQLSIFDRPEPAKKIQDSADYIEK